MDSKKKPENSLNLPKNFKRVLAEYVAKLSQSNARNANDVYKFSALYFEHELEKSQNKLNEPPRPVRNIDVQDCKINDIVGETVESLDGYSSNRETEADAPVEESLSAISEGYGKKHTHSSSPGPETCERCKMQRSCRGDETSESLQLQNALKLALLNSINRKVPHTPMRDEVKDEVCNERPRSRIIPKVSKDSSLSAWFVGVCTENEYHKTKLPFEKAMLESKVPKDSTKSTRFKNVHQQQKTESIDIDNFPLKSTKRLVHTNCSSKVDRTKMDKYYEIRNNTPQPPGLSESSLSLQEVLWVNSSVCNVNQWSSRHQKDINDDINENLGTCIRQYYTSSKLRQTNIRNLCRQKCHETSAEMKEVPNQILCRVKYRSTEPLKRRIDTWEYFLPDN